MEKIQIVTAEPNHIEGILGIKIYYIEQTSTALSTQAPTLAETTRWYQDRSGPYKPVVALLNEKVVGYACLSPFRLDLSPAYSISAENSIYIDPAYKNKGIGKMLMEKLFDIARHYQIKTIVSCITANNTDSIEFHRFLGFHYDGRLHNVAEKNGVLYDVAFMTYTL